MSFYLANLLAFCSNTRRTFAKENITRIGVGLDHLATLIRVCGMAYMRKASMGLAPSAHCGWDPVGRLFHFTKIKSMQYIAWK
jgi:hypothetical protein